MEQPGIHAALVGGLVVVLIGVAANVGFAPVATQLAQVGGTTGTTSDSSSGTDPCNSPDDDPCNDQTTHIPPPEGDPPGGTFPEDDNFLPPETTGDVHIDCPFNSAPNRTIIDFTHGGLLPVRELFLRADTTHADAVRIMNLDQVQSGVYTVLLASYHDVVMGTYTDLEEQWYLQLSDGNGGAVLTSHATRDMPDAESVVTELVARDVPIDKGAVKAMARHVAYPDTEPQMFAPLCAALDRVGDLPEEPGNQTDNEPDPSVIPEPVPTSQMLYRTCPIPERDNRIIVDFTRKGSVSVETLLVHANTTKDGAWLAPVPKYLPAGTYAVRLASHADTTEPRQDAQEWKAVLFDLSHTAVGQTEASRDIPDWEKEFVSRRDEALTIPKAVVRVGAVHARHPSEAPASVAPLCVSFDLVAKPVDTLPDPMPLPDTTVYMGEPEPGNGVTTNTTVVTKPEMNNQLEYVPSVKPPLVDESPTDDVVVVQVPVHHVQAEPKAIGVMMEGLVSVPEKVQERREEVVTTLEQTPFSLLQQASVEDREKLARQLLSQKKKVPHNISNEMLPTTATVTTPDADGSFDEEGLLHDGEPVLLARVSNENDDVPSADAQLKEQRHYLKKNDSSAAHDDTDGDGVSDYDEKFIYGTNPRNPFTAGSVLTDGERLLLGLDPQTDDVKVVSVESAKKGGVVDTTLFEIDTLTLESLPTPLSESVAHVAQDEANDVGQQLRVGGYTEPFSFVTIYIYSTPIIVTVRADESGRFEYTLDKTIEDGSHELYVATVNNSGRILAKSESVPFVKTAEAVERTPLTMPADPVQESTQKTTTMMLLLTLIIAVFSVVWLGVTRMHTKEEVVDVEQHDEQA